MVLIYSVTGFLMKHYDHIVNFFSAMLIGIFGTVLLVMFFAGLMTMGTIEKLLPFIIGFNAALTGYNLIRRMKDRLKYNRIWSVISGITLVVGVTLILNIAFYYLTGGHIVYMTNFLILALIGGVFSWLGTILAIRYFKLDIMNN
jgi:hypothetical protein